MFLEYNTATSFVRGQFKLNIIIYFMFYYYIIKQSLIFYDHKTHNVESDLNRISTYLGKYEYYYYYYYI